MSRPTTGRYVRTCICLLGVLWAVVAIEWVRRPPAPAAGILCPTISISDDPMARSHLHDRIAVIRMENVSFQAALEQLRVDTGATITVHWLRLKSVGVLPETPVTAVLFDVDLGTALRVILQSANRELDYGLLNGGTILVTRAPFDTPRFLAAYDIRDLLPPAPSTTAHPQNLAAGGIGSGGGTPIILPPGSGNPIIITASTKPFTLPKSYFEPPEPYERGTFGREFSQTIAELLKPNGDAQPKADAPPADSLPDITTWAHRLVVRATPEEHRKIADILRQLHSTEIIRKSQRQGTQ